MLGSQQLAKWVLGVFVLGTPLCPCASALADLATNAVADAPHHGGMHGDPAKPAEEPQALPCHDANTDSGADCGMGDLEDLAGLVKLERWGDLLWVPLAFSAMSMVKPVADPTLARPPPDNPRRRVATPVTAGDRLLT